MPSVGKAIPSALCTLLLLLSTAALADPIYKYLDKNGTPNYTDRFESIPEQYRSRVQTLDATTLQPFGEGSSEASKSTPSVTIAAPSVTGNRHSSEQGSSWLESLVGWKIPLPSDFQMAVGSTAIVLVLGAIALLRLSSNPFVRFGLKFWVMVVLGGSFYTLYFSGLNERMTEITAGSRPQTVSGKELLHEVTAKTKQVTTTIQQQAVEQFKTVVNKTTDSTIGETRRTVQQANQANEQLQKHLDEITGINTSPGSGENPEPLESVPSP